MAADDGTLEALREALEDEYRARATYRKVIETFGPVRPFTNIAAAEERHTKALLGLFERFGAEPPEDTWPERVNAPRTLAEACRLGVKAEIENEAMYARLMAKITDPQARSLMRQLQRASRERHLPAFRRCLERDASGRARPDRTKSVGPLRARIRRRGRR